MAHWYTRDGQSAHDADLKKARKEGLLPSVTGILEVMAKPGLEIWKQKQILLASLTLPRLMGESEDDYASRVMKDSKEQGSKAMELGTAIHSFAEDLASFNNQIRPIPEGYEPVCSMLREWINENLKGGLFELSMVSNLGYAGRIDWCSPDLIVDFKTSSNMVAYHESHCTQLTAYSKGNLEKRLINVYISTDTLNPEIRIKEWNMEEKGRAWEIFKACLSIWQNTKNYYPGWL